MDYICHDYLHFCNVVFVKGSIFQVFQPLKARQLSDVLIVQKQRGDLE